MSALFATETPNAIPIHILTPEALAQWVESADEQQTGWILQNGFDAALGHCLILPSISGQISAVLFGWGREQDRARGRLHFGALPAQLPKGQYYIETCPSDFDPAQGALAWMLAQYRFDRYRGQKILNAELVTPDSVDEKRLRTVAYSVCLTQDLINTPANDMTPDVLQSSVESLADAHSADCACIMGEDLVQRNFPMIHAVGRAAHQAPRLLDLTWGNAAHPKVTLVGKGVTFDTGGLNIKPGASMGLMKKDMGGAANAIGLAQMILRLELPVRLRLLIPVVENAISDASFRPGDILTSRKGLTVEVNNTDAEGRLVLADALAYGAEESPDLLLSLATLTGAARVALGPDIPPFFTDDDDLAHQITTAADRAEDPLWRMPFWTPYDPQIEPGIADLDNAPKGGMAGAITAALFLRRFVEGARSYAHFDLYGWTPAPLPGRPKGGAAQGIRALLDVIESRFA